MHGEMRWVRTTLWSWIWGWRTRTTAQGASFQELMWSWWKYDEIYGITPFCASVAVYLTCRRASFFWELWHVVAIKKLGQIYPSWKGTAFARRCTRKWNGRNVLWYCVRRKRSGKRTRGWGYLTFKREELGGRKNVNGVLAVWHMILYIHVTYIIYIQYVDIYIYDT